MSQVLNKKKIAIIGLGNIGSTIAANLVKGNRPVIVADRKMEIANHFSQTLGGLAIPMGISAAIKEADIVVLAVWYSAIKELFNKYAVELRGKIIVDPSNPIAPDEKGGFKKIVGVNESAGEILSSLLPSNARLVKALGTLGADSLASAAFQRPNGAVLFYATDEANLLTDVDQLIRDTGFEPVHIGAIDQSIRIEVFGDLHEYGALGKTVTLAEAKQKFAEVSI